MKEFFLNTGPVQIIFAGLFIISIFVQLYFYLFIYPKSFRLSPELNTKIRKYPPVSIVICARNEAENLEQKIPLFMSQEYPDFEVVVVNDRSEDDTKEVLEKLKKKYPSLRSTNIAPDPKFLRGKKLALTLGIKSAKNPYLLLSDADCEPSDNQWIKYMMRNYQENISIVLGIGLYKKRKGLLNLIIRFETAFNAMQYISLARAKKVYTGVGRNLSYKKEAFFTNKGFASHLKLESGDDDLFVNEVSNSQNTAIETHPGSFTYSEPETRWGSWVNQKKRHLTTSGYYRTSSKFILVAAYFSNISLILAFVFLVVEPMFKIYVLLAYTVLLLIKGINFKIAFNSLGEKYLFLPSIIIEAVIPWFYGFLHIINLFERKRSRWK